MKHLNPGSIAAPVSTYSHAIEVPAGARTLHVSGQIGVDADGTLGADAKEQSRLVWDNILKILAEAQMDLSNVVKVNAYLTDTSDMAAYGAARNAVLGEHRPCSTLVFVSALAKPDWKVEVDIVAAAAD